MRVALVTTVLVAATVTACSSGSQASSLTDALDVVPQDATSDAIKVASSSVDGSVLTLSLRTSAPRVLPEAVANRSLGFDLCF